MHFSILRPIILLLRWWNTFGDLYRIFIENAAELTSFAVESASLFIWRLHVLGSRRTRLLFVRASLEFIFIILWIIVLCDSNFFKAVTTLLESEKIIYLLYIDLSMYERVCKVAKALLLQTVNVSGRRNSSCLRGYISRIRSLFLILMHRWVFIYGLNGCRLILCIGF